MLQIKDITRIYKVGDTEQKALDNVSLSFRSNEFVAILGTSGAGKTTLLNIIGGLDRYDSGDLIINGVSTKNYKDRDWDSYRNHTIGFVFQSYNLIPHQTILSNVELALTISGISKSERIERAKKALIEVGLEQHLNKKPNQLSGGQMQRVAIARALVNNPSILLADEPTGALDSETSIQVMDMLKEVAKDRLVIMVTHNPELAEEYANRIVRVKDGKVLSDTNPFEMDEPKELSTKNMGKSSMSLLTSLSLSFNNLKTKKARTILTSFAGSIGIIGIALILSFSNGVNKYIADIQKETMTAYPISIESTAFDMSALIQVDEDESEEEHDPNSVFANNHGFNATSSISTSLVKNNLKDFKDYIENPENGVLEHVGENGIVYSYDTKFSIFTYDKDNNLINSDGSSLDKSKLEEMGQSNIANMMAFSGVDTNAVSNIASEILSNGYEVSPAVKDIYDVVAGRYPEAYNEFVLVISRNNEIDASVLYNLGILPKDEYNEYIKKINNNEVLDLENVQIDINKILTQDLYIVPQANYYVLNKDTNLYEYTEEPSLDNAIKANIVGIIKLNEDEDRGLVRSGLKYTQAFTDYIIDVTDSSDVVKAQVSDTKKSVISGYSFDSAEDATKIKEIKQYLDTMTDEDKLAFMNASEIPDEETRAQMLAMFNGYIENMTEDDLLDVYNKSIPSETFDGNMELFGVINKDTPTTVNIYVDNFEAKETITKCINDYNKSKPETEQIVYTDYIGLVLSSVTTIINVISYVLIAFVSVSLIVSSIMIGIITYISVLERTKEIGILRAMGASKKNVSNVFNAETFIIGLLSGLIGIGITLLLLIPANIIIHEVSGNQDVNAILPWINGVELIILSTILTLIGGIIPSKKAAKQNPVTALRTE